MRVCMLGPVLQSQAVIFSTNMSVFMYTVLIDRPETVVGLKSSIHVLHLFMFSAIMSFYFDTLAFTFSLRKADFPCKFVFSLFGSHYEHFCSTVGPYTGTGNFTVLYYSIHGSHFCDYSFQYIEIYHCYRSMLVLVSNICMYLVSPALFLVYLQMQQGLPELFLIVSSLHL